MSVPTPVLQIFLLGGVPRYFLFKETIHCLFGEKHRANDALHEALRKFITNRNEYFITKTACGLRKVEWRLRKQLII